MTDTSKTDIKFEPIAKAIGSRLLRVPSYQRSYAWELSHVQQYFDDLRTANDDSEPEYFLGSIVSTIGPEREEVVDGQQRLATTIVLLAAVRDYFALARDADRATQIESEYLFRKDLRTQETVPRLQLNDSDNAYFIKRILSHPSSNDRKVMATKSSHERIDDAAKRAAAFVTSVADAAKQPIDRLADLVESLAQKVKVVWLRAPDTANAFIIFETLNDRGLDLAISDLLKNYLFLLAEKRLDEVSASSTGMTATLESNATSVAVTEYIRHMWSSLHGATRERELYTAIKKKIDTKTAAVDFSVQLRNGATVYAAITSPDHPLWDKYGATAREHMGILNTLGMVQIRPLVLAVLETFTPREVKETLRLMVSWAVRLLIGGSVGGGTLEDYYSNAATKVRSKSITAAKPLRVLLAKVVPADAAFREAFSTARVSRAPLARYYLRALERAKEGVAQPELVPNANPEEIDLEHVMPKNLGSDWHVDDEDHRTYLNRIGNLVLLRQAENSNAKSDGFATKKLMLKKSQFLLTSSAGKERDWTPKTIGSRQQKLAALALKAWPIK